MASPGPASNRSTIPKSEPLVNAIQLSLRVKDNQQESATGQAGERNGCVGKSPDVPRIKGELELDLNRPLKHALGSIFKHGGKVLLTFPGVSYLQVKNVAEDIREKFDDRESERSIFSRVWSRLWPNSQFPDIDITVVQILTTSVPHYISLIKQTVQTAIGRDPTVHLVKLVDAATDNEALTVDPHQGPHEGRVYFKHFVPDNHELDDTSLFFRVEFEPIDQLSKTNKADDNNEDDVNVPTPVVIWINLKTLLPIAKDEQDDKLYAFLPETNIIFPSTTNNSSTIPPNIANPFYWLPTVVQGSQYQSLYFFREHGTELLAAIYPAHEPDPVVRISKGDNNDAVIESSSMEFVTDRIEIEGHTN